jgi:hypothetical protein
MPPENVQVKAKISRDLKRLAFAAFALREEKFNRWLRVQLVPFVKETEEAQGRAHDARLDGPKTNS